MYHSAQNFYPLNQTKPLATHPLSAQWLIRSLYLMCATGLVCMSLQSNSQYRPSLILTIDAVLAEQKALFSVLFVYYYAYHLSKTRFPSTASIGSTVRSQSALLLTLSRATFSRLIHVNEERSVKKTLLAAGPLKHFATHYGAFAAQQLYMAAMIALYFSNTQSKRLLALIVLRNESHEFAMFFLENFKKSYFFNRSLPANDSLVFHGRPLPHTARTDLLLILSRPAHTKLPATEQNVVRPKHPHLPI